MYSYSSYKYLPQTIVIEVINQLSYLGGPTLHLFSRNCTRYATDLAWKIVTPSSIIGGDAVIKMGLQLQPCGFGDVPTVKARVISVISSIVLRKPHL
jgi:hypothetical protein